MTNLFSVDVNIAQLLTDSLGRSPPQEKTDRILEPLQVMIQLALLSFCPHGTKLCVNNNLLSLQLPTLSQGIWRWFNKDSKEDLYFLFNAVKRYYIWYKDEDDDVFEQILILAKKGISKLIETYKNTDKSSITHALTLYRSILEMNSLDIFDEVGSKNTTVNTIFEKIRYLYTNEILLIVSNVFQLMEQESNKIFTKQYYDGLQLLLMPLNHKIQEWIHKELLCA